MYEVDAYDGDTLEFIKSFETGYAAAKFCDAHPAGVYRAVKYGYKANGYYFTKHGEPLKLKVPEKQKIVIKRFIVYNNITNEQLGEFKTQAEIARAFGISSECVSRAIRMKKFITHNLRIEVREDEN